MSLWWTTAACLFALQFIEKTKKQSQITCVCSDACPIKLILIEQKVETMTADNASNMDDEWWMNNKF